MALPKDLVAAAGAAVLRTGEAVELHLPAGELTVLVTRCYVIPAFAVLFGGWLGSLAGGDPGTALGAVFAMGLCYRRMKRYDAPRALGVVIAGAGRSGNGASNP